MSKTAPINKIKKSFQNLGIELTKNGPFYEFEYEFIPMLLSIDANSQSITFITPIINSSDAGLNEQVLKTALDIVEDSHNGYSGEWNNGTPFFPLTCLFIQKTLYDVCRLAEGEVERVS